MKSSFLDIIDDIYRHIFVYGELPASLTLCREARGRIFGEDFNIQILREVMFLIQGKPMISGYALLL